MSALADLKRRLGGDVVILAHHYQTDPVVESADLVGDSLELARAIPGLAAKNIVFCGVFFMAESAAMLASPEQRVFTPRLDAACVMSETAPVALAEEVHRRLESTGKKVIPLAYVNSQAAVKALCGRAGGSVCTSANAKTMLDWALKQGDAVLFLPDKNLGLNTADALGIHDRTLLDVRGFGARIDPALAENNRLLLWPGSCPIHTRMKVADVDRMRKDHPGALVVVHPECAPPTVQAADSAGSTSHIIQFCAQAPEGATIVVGTEINLVERLAKHYAGRKAILPLKRSACSNMAKTDPNNLARLLASMDAAEAVRIDPRIGDEARAALTRMLDVCAAKGA